MKFLLLAFYLIASLSTTAFGSTTTSKMLEEAFHDPKLIKQREIAEWHFVNAVFYSQLEVSNNPRAIFDLRLSATYNALRLKQLLEAIQSTKGRDAARAALDSGQKRGWEQWNQFVREQNDRRVELQAHVELLKVLEAHGKKVKKKRKNEETLFVIRTYLDAFRAALLSFKDPALSRLKPKFTGEDLERVVEALVTEPAVMGDLLAMMYLNHVDKLSEKVRADLGGMKANCSSVIGSSKDS